MFESSRLQSNDPALNFRVSMNISRLLVRLMARLCAIWLRVRFGSEYMSVPAGQLFRLIFLTGGFGVLVLLLVIGGISSSGNTFWFGVFMAASFARYLGHRIASLIRRKRGTQDMRENERQFSGVSLLHRLLPVLSETSVKRYVEPLLVLAVGYGISQVEPLLGGWLVIGGVCLFFDEQLEKAEQDRIERRWREMLSWQAQMSGAELRPRATVAAPEKRSEPAVPVPMPDPYAALSPSMRAWLGRERQTSSEQEKDEEQLTYESDLV